LVVFMPMTKFKSSTFPSPNMFMEPIQLGHQKLIHAFNFYVNFFHCTWCIWPSSPMASSTQGNLVTWVSKKFFWICHQTFLFLGRHAIGTINPSSLNSKLGVIPFELGFNPKGIHTIS
jgi:hypothetical protein